MLSLPKWLESVPPDGLPQHCPSTALSTAPSTAPGPAMQWSQHCAQSAE